MIVLIKPYGNHSNRLIQNLHFEAFCRSNQLEFANAVFSDMEKYYVSPAKHQPVNRIKRFYISRVQPKLPRVAAAATLHSFDKEGQCDSTPLLNHEDICYVKGWCFRDFDSTVGLRDDFRKRYALKPEFYQNNDFCKQFDDIDRDANNIIGVHIRRGDYKKFLGGIYYFEDDIYQKYLENVDKLLREHNNKNNIFIIFSNEDITLQTQCQTIKSANPWYVDQHLMGKCDYLIGPPSTFTLWASYIGGSEYFHMHDRSGEISLKQFSVCRG